MCWLSFLAVIQISVTSPSQGRRMDTRGGHFPTCGGIFLRHPSLPSGVGFHPDWSAVCFQCSFPFPEAAQHTQPYDLTQTYPQPRVKNKEHTSTIMPEILYQAASEHTHRHQLFFISAIKRTGKELIFKVRRGGTSAVNDRLAAAVVYEKIHGSRMHEISTTSHDDKTHRHDKVVRLWTGVYSPGRYTLGARCFQPCIDDRARAGNTTTIR